MSRVFLWLLLPLLLSFSSSASAEFGQRDQSAIYGSDDRVDYYELEDASLRAIAEQSVVALMSAYRMNYQEAPFSLYAPTVHGATGICLDEPFSRQPAAAFCSGVLIADDIVLTAGHCFFDEQQCPLTRFVFDYYYTEENALAPLNADSIYSCRQVVEQRYQTTTRGIQDWAIVQLDRPVSHARTPALLRTAIARDGNTIHRAPTVSNQAPVTMIGFPLGMPLKADAGGRVTNPRDILQDAFVTDLDAFAGNSGSGVWIKEAEEYRLAGILVSGEEDFEALEAGARCIQSKRCTVGTCLGENIVYLDRALEAFCETKGGHSIRHELCGDNGPQCGDGFCDYRERGDSNYCAQDCGPRQEVDVCGDGFCGEGEWSSCLEDCQPMMPADASCDPANFGTFDGCHASCAVQDPDCKLSRSSNSLFNCQHGLGSAAALWALWLVFVALWYRRKPASVSSWLR